MCINVACCADVTVTEPLLNLLQAHAIGIEQTGTTMAQIVKADTLHLVCDQKIREMLTQKVGPNPLSNRVYIFSHGEGCNHHTSEIRTHLKLPIEAVNCGESGLSGVPLWSG